MTDTRSTGEAPGFTLQHCRGDAVVLHTDLPDQAFDTRPKVPRRPGRPAGNRPQRVSTATQPTSAGLKLVKFQEA